MSRLKNASLFTLVLQILLLWGASTLGVVSFPPLSFEAGMILGVAMLILPYLVLRASTNGKVILNLVIYLGVLVGINTFTNGPVAETVGVLGSVLFYLVAWLLNYLPDRAFNQPLRTRQG